MKVDSLRFSLVQGLQNPVEDMLWKACLNIVPYIATVRKSSVEFPGKDFGL